MKVKICGVRRAADVEVCLAVGVDHIGFNRAPRSRRHLTLAKANMLSRGLAPGVGIAVFDGASTDDILQTLSQTRLTAVQLHGPVPADLYQRLPGGTTVLRALPADQREHAEQHAPFVHGFLLDGPKPGSGEAWPWEGVGESLAGRPVFLAGGLRPDNVAAAIALVRPAGVDVASGVEGPSGEIDPVLVRAFVRAARAVEER